MAISKNIFKNWVFTTLFLSLLVACNGSSEDALLAERLEQENRAYEIASNDGSVEAFGVYIQDFPEGQNVILADAEAWRVTKRQDSTAAYEAYLNHFPEGRYIRDAFYNYQSGRLTQIAHYESKAADIMQVPHDNFIKRAKDIAPVGHKTPEPVFQKIPTFAPLPKDPSISQGQALEAIAANTQNSVFGRQTNQNYFNNLENQRQQDHKRAFESLVAGVNSANANAQNLFEIQLDVERQRFSQETQLNQLKFEQEKKMAALNADGWLKKANSARLELSRYKPKDNAPITSIYWSDGDSGRITLSDATVIKFRLDDWDAPETGGVGAAIGPAQCELERKRGFNSKDFMVENTREHVSYKTKGETDRYERLLVDIYVNGSDIALIAASKGHLKSWRHDGDKALEPRPSWCAN